MAALLFVKLVEGFSAIKWAYNDLASLFFSNFYFFFK